ncbi:hypothetical protein BRD18_04230 [Halobacteriales archaeon SW_7_71_33]|nr:MAG: hypothetical protein BRD18_04230 [Halobacteriales archaeon SW_7_71_33]
MMARSTTTDALTENGIATDHPDVTMTEYRDLHGEPLVANEEVVVFSDEHGHELREWADALDMSRGALSERMHELAREHVGDHHGRIDGGDPFATADPVVFDAAEFAE